MKKSLIPKVRNSAFYFRIMLMLMTQAGLLFFNPPASAQTPIIPICGNISANVTWIPTYIYVITCDVYIQPGVTLSIQAGTILKFHANTSLVVNGNLNTQGDISNHVVFTSFTDDTHGGDTNEDGVSYGQPGYWSGIYLNNSSVTLDYSKVLFSANGISTGNNASPTIFANLIQSNTCGVSLGSGKPTVTNNSFLNNSRHLCQNAMNQTTFFGNSFSGNGGDAILITSNVINAEVTWQNIQEMGWPYYIPSSLVIEASGTLHLPAGTIVKSGSAGTLSVYGILDPQGDASSQVVFTAYTDDTHGGDSNGDGGATTPFAGFWSGILIYNSSVQLDHCLIQYAVDGVVISNSANPILTQNLIRYNLTGIRVTSGMPEIHYNDILGNTNYGMFKPASPTAAAENNYWGSTSGPYHSSSNPAGRGNAVSDHVEYRPYLTSLVTIPPPAATGLTALVNGTTVNLSWDSVDGASGYKIYYDDDQSGPPYLGTQAAQGHSPLEVGLNTSATVDFPIGAYYITVTAYSTGGESPYSNEVLVKVLRRLYLPAISK